MVCNIIIVKLIALCYCLLRAGECDSSPSTLTRKANSSFGKRRVIEKLIGPDSKIARRRGIDKVAREIRYCTTPARAGSEFPRERGEEGGWRGSCSLINLKTNSWLIYRNLHVQAARGDMTVGGGFPIESAVNGYSTPFNVMTLEYTLGAAQPTDTFHLESRL